MKKIFFLLLVLFVVTPSFAYTIYVDLVSGSIDVIDDGCNADTIIYDGGLDGDVTIITEQGPC